MCQDCIDTWGQELVDRVDAFIAQWPGSEYGPAHVVLDDLNLDAGCIEWCQQEVAKARRERDSDALGATAAFLADLLADPERQAREATVFIPWEDRP